VTKATAGTKQFVLAANQSRRFTCRINRRIAGVRAAATGLAISEEDISALAAPEVPPWSEFNSAARARGQFWIRMLSAGIDGLVARIELANAAETPRSAVLHLPGDELDDWSRTLYCVRQTVVYAFGC